MSAVKLALLCVVGLAAADYEDWKATRVERVYTARVQPLFQGRVESLDDCFDEVEGTRSAKIVQFHETSGVCMLFEKFSITDANLTEANADYALFYESDTEEDTGITTGGIIATAVLVPVFLIILVALAIVCHAEETDVAAQMERLEHAELHKEEAVSEHWERKSHEAEAAAEKAADAN